MDTDLCSDEVLDHLRIDLNHTRNIEIFLNKVGFL